MKNFEQQKARRIEVSKITMAIDEAIPLDVDITSILLALADLTRKFTSVLISKLEDDNEN